MTITQQKKTAKAKYNDYCKSWMWCIEQAYENFSSAKWLAWNHCANLINDYKGWGMKIISYNSFIFTAGFLFKDEETGKLMFMYITPNYEIAVEV